MKKLEIISSFSDMKSKPHETSNIISQSLFGEQVEVLSKNEKWFFCKSAVDNYKGWLKKETLGFSNDKTHFVKQIRAPILESPEIKSNLILFIPMRAQVTVNKIEGEWAKISLTDNNMKFGYIKSNTLIKKSFLVNNFIPFARKFLGTPYRWGGRDSSGIDCSSLIQLTLSFCGLYLPRDSKDQFDYFCNSDDYEIVNEIILKYLALDGDIIYWPGHIGFLLKNNKILHSSSFHGQVIIERKDLALDRMKQKATILKRVAKYN